MNVPLLGCNDESDLPLCTSDTFFVSSCPPRQPSATSLMTTTTLATTITTINATTKIGNFTILPIPQTDNLTTTQAPESNNSRCITLTSDGKVPICYLGVRL